MNQLCFTTHLSSSDTAAWAQAIISSIALLVGAGVVIWQTRRARLELCEREARAHNGLARLLIHLKEAAQEARAQRRNLERWPIGHPAEPSSRFAELTNALHQFPLDSIHGELPLNALLTARRAARELTPIVGPEPELEVNPNFENVYLEYVAILDQQIMVLRIEAQRLFKGEYATYAAGG